MIQGHRLPQPNKFAFSGSQINSIYLQTKSFHEFYSNTHYIYNLLTHFATELNLLINAIDSGVI